MKQEQHDEALLSQVAQTSDQCHPSLNRDETRVFLTPYSIVYLTMLWRCNAQCNCLQE